MRIRGDVWGALGFDINLAVLVFIVGLGLTFALAIILSKIFHFGAEGSRKAIHLGLGLNSLALPWLFSEPMAVWGIALGAILTLGWLRSHKLRRSLAGNALHAVDRQSWGDLCFPLSIAILFHLAWIQQQAWLYWLPIFLLTVSDAVSALIGVRWGKNKYATVDGWKSIEGSIAFFGCTFLITLAAIGISGMSHASHLFPAAFLFSALLTLVEGVSWRGLDNLLTPLGAYVWMDRLLTSSPASIWQQVLILVFLMMLMAAIRTFGQLSARAMFLLVLAGETYAGLGGWWWMALPLWYLIANTRLRSSNPHRRPLAVSEAVSVNLAPMLWIILNQINPTWLTSTGFAIGFLSHWLMTTLAHQEVIRCKDASHTRGFSPLAWLLVFTLFIAIWPWINLPFPAAAILCLLCLGLTWVLFHYGQMKPYGAQDQEGQNGRWLRQGFIGLTVSWCAILITHWLQSSPNT